MRNLRAASVGDGCPRRALWFCDAPRAQALGQQRAHHQLHPTWDRVWLGRFGDDIEASGIELPRRTEKTAFIQLYTQLMSIVSDVFEVTKRPPGRRRIDIGALAGPLVLMVATSKAGRLSGA